MKKLILAAFAVFAFASVQAQTFGALGGLSLYSGSGDVSGSETGFHIGAFADFELSDQFGLQPEVTYAMAGDYSAIGVNAIAKYAVSDEFSIHAGPTFAFVGGDVGDGLDAISDAFDIDTTKLNISLAFGGSYDISEELFVQARYGFQLNNHISESDAGDFKYNVFTVGVGYRFGG